MKLFCKLFGHKWSKWRVYLFGTHEERFCRRCYITDKRITRSELDESENVLIDEDRVNDLWDRCLKSNSYTHMGSEIRFDKIADMVIGEKQWHMRDQALLTTKSMGKLLTPEKKLEILKVSGVSESKIDNCYKKEKQ